MNVNEKGMIYYGTDIKYMEEIDARGLSKPRAKNDQFISVSVSGYLSEIKIEHPEIAEMANIYANILNICNINNHKLQFHEGYENTITYIDGFGPNPSKYINSIYGIIDNTRTHNTATVVIDKSAQKYLVRPSKDRKFEYLSLALHSFIKCIKPEMIVGWIVPEVRKNEIIKLMEEGRLQRRKIWVDTDFDSKIYDTTNRAKYGIYPSNIEMYLKDINQSKYYYLTRYNHLKSIFRDFDEIDWNIEKEYMETSIREWVNSNKEHIAWNSEKFKYEYINNCLVSNS